MKVIIRTISLEGEVVEEVDGAELLANGWPAKEEEEEE